jgi:hypothetical protein
VMWLGAAHSYITNFPSCFSPSQGKMSIVSYLLMNFPSRLQEGCRLVVMMRKEVVQRSLSGKVQESKKARVSTPWSYIINFKDVSPSPLPLLRIWHQRRRV